MYVTLRTFIAIAVNKGMILRQMDVETAYLNAGVDEDIYAEQPEGFQIEGNWVCKLLRAIYGLKQAGRNWNQMLVKFLKDLGLEQSEIDTSMFASPDKSFILLIYVDDIIFASKSKGTLDDFERVFTKRFRCTPPSNLNWALGMEIRVEEGSATLAQPLYLKQFLERHDMLEARATGAPLPVGGNYSRADGPGHPGIVQRARRFVGTVLYAAMSTRPDLANAVCQLSHLMAAPPTDFENHCKHVLRYLKGSQAQGLTYRKQVGNRLIGYADASWGDHKDSRRSTTGYVFLYGGAAISWTSKLQRQVALSSVEAEYVALVHAIQEVIFLRRLLASMGDEQIGPTIIFEDNTGAQNLIAHPTSHTRTKHIDIRRKWLDEVINGEHPVAKIQRVDTTENLADLFTKPLHTGRHQALVKRVCGEVNTKEIVGAILGYTDIDVSDGVMHLQVQENNEADDRASQPQPRLPQAPTIIIPPGTPPLATPITGAARPPNARRRVVKPPTASGG